MLVICGNINLKTGTETNPVNIDAIAPFSFIPFQNIDKIITGQKVAAIPDHPNITNQKTVLVGEIKDTIMATPNAKRAKTSVVIFENRTKDN